MTEDSPRHPDHRPRARTLRRSPFSGLLVTLALVTAACGGSSAGDDVVASLSNESGGSDDATDAAEVDSEETLLAFAACMRDNGIDLPDPQVDEDGDLNFGFGPGGGGVAGGGGGAGGGDSAGGGDGEDAGPPFDRQSDEFGAAQEACGDLLEDLDFGFDQADQAEVQDQILAMTECLRDQGLDVDDPDFSGGFPGGAGQAGEGGDGAGGAGGGPGGRGPLGLDFDDPATQDALDVCGEELGGFGPPGGRFGGGDENSDQ